MFPTKILLTSWQPDWQFFYLVEKDHSFWIKIKNMKQTHWAHCKNSASNSFHISWSWLIKYMISEYIRYISVHLCISKIPMVLLEYHSEAVDCSKTGLFLIARHLQQKNHPPNRVFRGYMSPSKMGWFFKQKKKTSPGPGHQFWRLEKTPAATPKGCWSRSAKPRTLPMAWRTSKT